MGIDTTTDYHCLKLSFGFQQVLLPNQFFRPCSLPKIVKPTLILRPKEPVSKALATSSKLQQLFSDLVHAHGFTPLGTQNFICPGKSSKSRIASAIINLTSSLLNPVSEYTTVLSITKETPSNKFVSCPEKGCPSDNHSPVNLLLRIISRACPIKGTPEGIWPCGANPGMPKLLTAFSSSDFSSSPLYG